jgi:tyrosyl-tRNA synthetase
MNFIEQFTKRGYLYQATNITKLTDIITSQKICAYVGFDVTAKSLHVGNLMQVMIMRLLQQHGHKPIIIVGGATTKIGDPTGKDKMRKMLSDEDIEENMVGLKKSLSKFLTFGEGPSDALLLNNSLWLEKINYIEFLRDFGKYFSINKMLTMESVKARLDREQHLSYLEFNYMLLQGYDFYHLYKNNNCMLQFGGSDQWGNIITGIDLIHKTLEKEAFGITTPLLTTSSGVKMGKTEGGAVWLNEDMLRPYDYFQFWRNTEDLDVLKFANLYAEYTENELQEFSECLTLNINEAKEKLSHRLTELCHGKDNADKALKASIDIFSGNGIDETLPTIELRQEDIVSGINIIDLLHLSDPLMSKSDIKRLVRGGGAKVNNEKIENENFIVSSACIIDRQYIRLSFGKKKHSLVKII